jgi:hypothetical protein
LITGSPHGIGLASFSASGLQSIETGKAVKRSTGAVSDTKTPPVAKPKFRIAGDIPVLLR